MKSGDNTTRRRVSRSGQSDAVDGIISISKADGGERANNDSNDKYEVCGINVEGIVMSVSSTLSIYSVERGVTFGIHGY